MNIKIFLILAMFPAFQFADEILPGEKEFQWRQETNSAFGVGESLTFNISWHFIYIGFGTLEVESLVDYNGRKAYHLLSRAESAAWIDNFYKVRDINESLMDFQSLCTLNYSSHIREGRDKRDETVIYDHENQTYRVVETSKTGTIPLWVNDVLSALYYVRTKDLSVGASIVMDGHTGDKSWPLIVHVIKTEEIDTSIGKVKCWVVEPKIREGAGIFKAKGTLKIWLTADEKKIPVYMTSKVALGYVEAKLANMKLGTYTDSKEPANVLE
ncbi:MAG: hypothetical protein A2204_05485 [Elusimicrobia bacterium RIFOXYA1_FULL_47_7]|nr:MAG: hypothetical protein A2278_00520 [Elusimicrobia bacterium RIFOXYA12_FULL_49_49]OGS06180.1 MAG: hypothetical protein A2204_05485 [Elusimicrobia bacterium RIFOXYA1_FULL_47_7]OGS11020.1 MAG: hypothetical protein A2386_00385 [Elusimicrobia bacterium RIFOXYB1_FULL_48_9]OGS15143.1 MAG: hypothetical protein A2251_00530 [Elusimicrobia bacterium RIFOXYA2_FULL_47_53]OGS29763.1 MAG: hypothetical protein A2323_01330 [Elusimicrobia bacterium RIFOXYB2_FULL_46_23]